MKKAVLISLGCEDRLRLIKEVLQPTYDVSIFISDFSHAEKQYIESKAEDCNYIHTLPYQKNLSLGRIMSYIFFGRAVSRILKDRQPDLVYVMLPPNYVAWKCLQYTRKRKIFFVTDLYDLWPESLPIKKIESRVPFILRKWADLRNKCLRVSNCVFTECELYQENLVDVLRTEQTVKTLYIEKDLSAEEIHLITDKIRLHKQGQDSGNPIIKLGYLGSINYIIDMKRIAEIAKGLVEAGRMVEFHIIGGGEGRDNLLECLKTDGINVLYHGMIYDMTQKINILAQCDFALNLMVSNVKVGLTTKSIDYFSMGIPIINSIKGDTWKLVEKYQVGINDSPNVIEDIIEVHNNKELIANMHNNSYELYKSLFTRESFIAAANEAFFEAGIINEHY